MTYDNWKARNRAEENHERPEEDDGSGEHKIVTWTYERAAEDDAVGFYIRHDNRIVATTDTEEWAQHITAALTRDDAAHAPKPASNEPEIRF